MKMQKNKKKTKEDFPVQKDSWTVLSEGVFIKKTDRSVFFHHGTGIPKDLREYFNVDQLTSKKKIEVKFILKSIQYDAFFEITKSQRTRLMWKQDFSKLIMNTFPAWKETFEKKKKVNTKPPQILFKRKPESLYVFDIEFISKPLEPLATPYEKLRGDKSSAWGDEDIEFDINEVCESPPPQIIINKVKARSSRRKRIQVKRNHDKIAAENAKLGEKGEDFVIDYEKKRLSSAGRGDLIKKIKHIAKNDDSAGFDILSVSDKGEKIYIEVKTTMGSKSTPFFMSSAEREFCKDNIDSYFLYRVFNYGTNTKLYEINGKELLDYDFYAVNYLVGCGNAKKNKNSIMLLKSPWQTEFIELLEIINSNYHEAHSLSCDVLESPA